MLNALLAPRAGSFNDGAGTACLEADAAEGSEKSVLHVAKPRVVLVGAGPGDPGLLTVAAAQAVTQADVVLADRLVPESILKLAQGTVQVSHLNSCGFKKFVVSHASVSDCRQDSRASARSPTRPR